MNYARRLARRAASRKGRAAVKDQTRRGIFAERLEDRSLMAADIYSGFHNYSRPTDVNADGTVAANDVLMIINSINALGSRALPQTIAEGESTGGYLDVDNDGNISPNDVLTVINHLNAEGEAGSTLPQKATYTLQILGPTGSALTTGANRTASIRQGTDFYIQLVGQDNRPAGTDPTGKALVRGIFSAYTDILYDINFATPVTNELQTIFLNYLDQNTSDPTTPPPAAGFTLTLPANASGISGTTAPIAVATKLSDPLDPSSALLIDTTATATNIQNALDVALFGAIKNRAGTKVAFNGAGKFNVYFNGINNQDLPLLTSNQPTADITVAELQSGAPTNLLAAMQLETDGAGAFRYPNDPAIETATFGLNDVGSFTGASGLSGAQLPVLRIHMVATQSTTTPVVFTPDPLGDGSQSPEDMLRPKHNTLVYGNENVKDQNGNVVELEKSLVIFSETNNEFTNLVPVTLTINTGPYTAVPDNGNTVDENTTVAGTNTVSISVLTNDTLTTAGATKQIKSFDATTNGGTITQSGDNLIFKPNVGFNGTATFSYTAGAAGGAVADDSTATVSVTVAAVNSAPVVTVPGQQTPASENTDVIFSAANGNAITVADADVAETAPGELLMTLSTTANSTLTLGSTAGINSVTGDGTAQITFKGTPANVNAALSGLKLSSSVQTGNTATITIIASDQGSTGKPVGTALTDTKTINVVFPSVNDAPAISIGGVDISGISTNVVGGPNQDFDFTAKGKPLAVTDPDAGSGNLTVTLALQGTGNDKLTASGTGVSGSGTRTVTITGSLTTIATALGTVVYTPETGSTASATMTITANDGGNTGTGGAQTTTGTVIIDLDPGVRPFPVDDSALINEANTNTPTALVIDALANDFKAVGATTTIVSVTQPPAGQGSVAIVNDKLEYTPPTNSPDFFTPSTPVRFTYTIHDDVAGSTDRTGTVSITVKNVVDKPVAVNDGPYGASFANGVGTTLTVNAADGVLKNDSSVDNNFGVSNYATLTAVLDQTTTKGTLVLNANGSFTYTPTSFNAASPDDTFTYHVNSVTPEGTEVSTTATVTIHVTAPPVATNDHFNVLEQGNPATSGNVLTGAGSTPASGADTDGEGQTLTVDPASFVQISDPSKGSVTLNADGSFTYNPPTGQNFNTTRPAAPDVTFTYRAKATDGRLSNVATVSLTVQEVNDAPTALPFDFLGVKRDGSIGVDQPVAIPADKISTAPDVSESLKVTALNGVAADSSGNTAAQATPKGGSVRLSNFQILYTSPTSTTAENDPDTFTYTVSDFDSLNGNAPRVPQLSATATVSVKVVAFVPKQISGAVYIDANNNATFEGTEKALGGVKIELVGNDAFGLPVQLFTTTDAQGKYVFPDPNDASTPQNFLLKPPDASGYIVRQVSQPAYLLPGKDSSPASPTNVDSSTQLQIVTNSSATDNQFKLNWSLTDQSAFDSTNNVSKVVGLNFGEGTINTSPTDPDGAGPATAGLSDASGLKYELLASSGKNGFIVAADMSGHMMWDWSIEGDANAWSGCSLVSAVLSSDLSTLTVMVSKGGTTYTTMLTQGYSIPGSSARFRILGIGQNGEYILRIDGSFNGTTVDPRTGLTDAMFASSSATLQGAEGEARNYRDYTNSADAVFNDQAWA